ncbi:hypothetical protein [Acinetobacter sp. MD2(2019)]|uniref:hypothetical protein n=1 Tax=Acinetobacter sp. MD2(2019) TaxID=2605273 RepID=UPI002D1E5322|nr:hypothetical protein [Acinetobacter sp. MD2(2019)]MEB3753768.1 hypothetical protein [Acinetobacter sp. MD2(2019)]
MKNFNAETYLTDQNISDTITWLLQHQDCFDEFHFNVNTQELTVIHAAGTDIIRAGQFLNARYGILVTSL